MIDIVIPMAGEGRRFAEAGYTDPKPLIDVAGKPMIQRVMDCLRPADGCRFTLVTRLAVGDVDAEVIQLDRPTSGAVDSLLRGLVHGGPVLVANCDQYITGSIDEFLATAAFYDAAVMTFNSTNPHHSYVKVSDGLVTEIAEKVVISDEAVAGIYWFADANTLRQAAANVIRSERRHANGEFYISAVIDEYVKTGRRVGVFEVDVREKHMLGTPEELRIFLDKVADGRVVL